MEEIDYTTGFWLDEPENSDVVFDGDIYESKLLSKCCFCLNNFGYKGCAPICKLFPKGIPPKFWLEKQSCTEYIELPKSSSR